MVAHAASPCAADTVNNVDIFNATSGAWSTAALSVARYCLAAASLPNHGVVIFAGGYGTCLRVIIFMNRTQSVLSSRAARTATPVSVDIFNVASGAWSTAALSVARGDLTGTSLPNIGVAIFAGGYGTFCCIFPSY